MTIQRTWKLALVAMLLAAVSHPLFGAVDIKSFEFPDGRPRITVSIDGPISKSDLDELQRGIDLRRRPYIVVFVGSQGGDWNAAMAIGRFLRGAGAAVNVSERGCYSSCVLLLAGGLRRQVLGPVGIHRPYTTDVSPQSFQDAQRRYRALEATAKSYLFEMNLPDALFDAMVRVSPESIRILKPNELELFGLSQDDPVAKELDDAEEAREFGIAKEEYLRRKARRDTICQPQDLGRGRQREAIALWMNCKKDVMRGLR